MNKTIATIISLACDMGVALTEDQATRMARHLALVEEQNAVMNLTRVTGDEAVGRHLIDSLAGRAELDTAPAGPFADIGSGAGFPGVPLAIVTGRPVTLVESVKKKAVFLEAVVADLCLEATVRGVRAEELAVERREHYAAVTARALSSLPSLVELASPLLQTGGLLICYKGDPDPDELKRGDKVARMCGMGAATTRHVVLPGQDAVRTMVTYRKECRPKMSLPRRNGLAQRSPLA